jgi:gas vesicle protein
MCAHKCPMSLHKHKINHRPPQEHPLQLRIVSKLKKMRNKFKIKIKLKKMTYIKWEMKKKIKKRRMTRRFKQQRRHIQESIKQFKEITPSI